MSRVLPILFNTEMVRAILDERKTTTRRCLKPQPVLQNHIWILDDAGWTDNISVIRPVPGHSLWNRMPYHPEDILYVRETFRPLSSHPNAGFEYASDWSQEYFENSRDSKACNGGKWKPSIHMPKEAAQIWLRVTDVRVERLQDITDIEAEKEGAQPQNPFDYDVDKWPNKEHFKEIWNSTIKKQDIDLYAWGANPWVWVIEFERCDKPEEG